MAIPDKIQISKSVKKYFPLNLFLKCLKHILNNKREQI